MHCLVICICVFGVAGSAFSPSPPLLMRKIAVIMILLITGGYAYALPSFEDVKKSYKKSDAVLLDRHGAVEVT